mmetsp:Transcript_72221/g.145307  ORF Transcript_72221/g.145307 Transcript_72221/m.145307 type:complete len:156 (-) Transcript_72221:230-697(-)|eukprot:CAMPEP_0171948842 /NCGR_PEP_ID=MMETSP0993-20121228/69127_1 /TAXON_ID=483369 /ORGANISM="non described non described, Strain CCMP2098" /LENGTH=155 /DNA_ID=CAMNT_0012593081 /DNA_START=49 /DNA_END=516 /DNA_ORIENTATION=-
MTTAFFGVLLLSISTTLPAAALSWNGSPMMNECRQTSRRNFVGFVGLSTLGLGPSLTSATEGESIFVGTYSDPNHPGGVRNIELLDTKIGEFQLARVTGGGGSREPASFVLPAMVQLPDKKITIDFSPKGGPKNFSGVWEENGIRFPDGNKWPKK